MDFTRRTLPSCTQSTQAKHEERIKQLWRYHNRTHNTLDTIMEFQVFVLLNSSQWNIYICCLELLEIVWY
jgi:hypothetical protein